MPLSSVAKAWPIETGVSPPVASIITSGGGMIVGLVKSPGIWVNSVVDSSTVSVMFSDVSSIGCSSSIVIGVPNF